MKKSRYSESQIMRFSMKKSRYTDSQILAILRQNEAGTYVI